jgi:two-component system cell cycle sensor histidine kinase/response regulator CckA
VTAAPDVKLALVEEENFALLVHSVSDYAIFMLDPAGRVATWNLGAERIKGYSAGEIVGSPSSCFYTPEDVAAAKPAKALQTAADSGRFEDEGWRVRKDGSRFWANVVITALRAEDGHLRGFAKVTRDITAAKVLAEEAERTRQAYEERDQVFALSTDLIGISGFDGHFKRVNPSWTRTLGWTEAEIQARSWLDFVHPDDVEATRAADQKLRAGLEVALFQNRYLCKSGAYRWLEWKAVAVVADSLIYVIGRDVTESKLSEARQAQLRQKLVVVDRMVSVGTLAAGVAHEINNPLSAVTGNLDVLVEELRALSGGSLSGKLAELEEMAIEARLGAERVRKIVRGLKTFARANDERRAVMDVRPALELAIDMASNEIRHRARLLKDFGETPLVEVNDAQLGQVFTNLLINAAQAIPEGNAEGHEIRIATSTDASGRAVIEIQDTGSGIPADLGGRIFDPFFTTKGVGVGTGLGLWICHNIVTAMEGEISASNRVGRGATFRVALPAAKVQQLRERIDAPVGPSNERRGVVLVVDDELAVGAVLGRILRDHEVTVLMGAREAVDLIASGKEFDVIFSDLMMPQMTGMDFYRELARVSPDHTARMIFVTGGAFTSVAAEFLAQVGNERIEKPFAAATIREMVQRYLK